MGLTIFTYSLRDRVVAMLVGSLAIGVLLLFSMAVYADIDLSFYYELPPAVLETMGISPEAGGVGGIAYGAMYNLMGAMTLAGLAIAIGTAAIAGEEQSGTLGLLLANPRSRSRVVLAKVAALVVLVTLGAAVMYAAGLIVPPIVGTDVEGVQVAALVVHVWANALFWGMLALAFGAWTGQPSVAAGVSTATMVISWLATSLLPMIEGGTAFARVFPWYWFNSSVPEVNGVDATHLAVLLGACLVFLTASLLGIGRRDLRSGGGSVTVLDRLRANRHTQAWADRIGGQAMVSGIATKTASEHRSMTVIVASIALYMALLMPIFYTFLPEGMTEFFEQLPDSLIAMVGGVDMSTAAGFLQGEVFAITVPIAMIALTATVGATALAGEEESRTMGLLLANRVSRGRVVAAKATAIVVLAAIVGMTTFAGTVIGVLIAGLDIRAVNVGAICVLATLLAIDFGGLALLIGGLTGRVRMALGGAAGAAVVAYVVYSFLPLSPRFEGWAVLSPFHFYLGSEPLTGGMPWGDAAVLVAIAVALVALAVPSFTRRDLRG